MPTLDAIGVIVSDLQTAAAFYGKLGLDFGTVDSADGHAEATGPGGIRVMLDTEASVQSFSAWVAPTGSYRVALAFLCEAPAEVDRLFAELTAAGGTAHLRPFDAPWRQRYATVLDDDGNAVDLFAYLA